MGVLLLFLSLALIRASFSTTFMTFSLWSCVVDPLRMSPTARLYVICIALYVLCIALYDFCIAVNVLCSALYRFEKLCLVGFDFFLILLKWRNVCNRPFTRTVN